MSDVAWPTFKAMGFLRLREGPSDGVELDLAPTMKEITYAGERYFRISHARSLRPDGSYGASYLWDRWEPKPRTEDVELP